MSALNYLDIVPDKNTTKKDTYANKDKAERYFYSCYGYLPQYNIAQDPLDQFTGNEVVSAFIHKTFTAFPKGNFTACNPVISYWNPFFQRICPHYVFLDIINKIPDLDDVLKTDYKAQTTFFIGYYHYLLTRCYGSII